MLRDLFNVTEDPSKTNSKQALDVFSNCPEYNILPFSHFSCFKKKTVIVNTAKSLNINPAQWNLPYC